MWRSCYLYLLVLGTTPVLNAQNSALFSLMDATTKTNERFGFISLSEIYDTGEQPDSLIIPGLQDPQQDNLQCIELDGMFRKKFLSATKISETDQVYVYDYATDKLLVFPVKQLRVFTYLTVYMHTEDCPCSSNDYMIGFKIAHELLEGLGPYYSTVLVAVGEENPFVHGQMKAIVWTKINSADFPSSKASVKIRKQSPGSSKGDAYSYESGDFRFYIQDILDANNSQVIKRNLLIVDKKTGEVIIESIFVNSEGTSLAPLNFGIADDDGIIQTEQWTGKLLKNEPEVFFGFEWVSFGCPGIQFIDAAKKSFSIKCDNRH